MLRQIWWSQTCGEIPYPVWRDDYLAMQTAKAKQSFMMQMQVQQQQPQTQEQATIRQLAAAVSDYIEQDMDMAAQSVAQPSSFYNTPIRQPAFSQAAAEEQHQTMQQQQYWQSHLQPMQTMMHQPMSTQPMLPVRKPEIPEQTPPRLNCLNQAEPTAENAATAETQHNIQADAGAATADATSAVDATMHAAVEHLMKLSQCKGAP